MNKLCSHCGTEPFKDHVMNILYCPNEKCPIYKVSMLCSCWNKRKLKVNKTKLDNILIKHGMKFTAVVDIVADHIEEIVI